MTGTAASGGTLVQRRQFAAFGIDGKRADRAGWFALETIDFIRREEQPAFGVEIEERWIWRFGGQSKRSQGAVRRIHAPGINALALRSRISADVHEARAIQCRFGVKGALGVFRAEEGDAEEQEQRQGNNAERGSSQSRPFQT